MLDLWPNVRHDRRSDALLRLAGIGLLAVAALAVRALIAVSAHHLGDPATVSAMALAGLGFVAASVGAALLVLGHHIHDEADVSARWTPCEPRGFAKDNRGVKDFGA